MKTLLRMIKKLFFILALITFLGGIFYFLEENPQFIEIPYSFFSKSNSDLPVYPTAIAKTRSFDVEIKTTGEIEAARSITISSAVRGDLGKVVYLVEDGKHVQAGETLVKMDPTPFEKSIEELEQKISEQQGKISAQAKALEWEKERADYDLKSILAELEVSKLEINKLIEGEGPIEMGRLKNAMQKAQCKYEETRGYYEDLQGFETNDLFTPSEIKQVEKKLKEEEEAYTIAKLQYDSYVEHVHPMLVKKAELAQKRAAEKIEETKTASLFRIASAKDLLDQYYQQLNALNQQLHSAKIQLSLTEIKAQTPGLVVLKEDFRNGQMRKPRLGDLILKNQVILDLPDLSSAIVKTRIREVDLYKIQKGTPVIVEVDAYPELMLKGEIDSIGILAVLDHTKMGDQKHFEVIVKLLNSDSKIRPGMTSRLKIQAKSVKEALTVPIQAIFEQNKQTFCCVKNADNTHYWRGVKVGWSNEHLAEIIAGLDEEDEVFLVAPEETPI